MELPESTYLRKRLIAIGLSFGVGILLMVLKFYVYWLTQSSAVLSDALESIINVVASAFAMISIMVAAKPPDRSHPYGHGKIEYFSAGFEGALIVFAAFGIIRVAVPQIFTPHELVRLQAGLLILLGTSAANLVLGIGLLRVGRKSRSLALVADGKHILTDVYTSAGVLLGLVLVQITGWYWMDGVIALLVALNILVIGAKLMRESFGALMDASDPGLLQEISTLLSTHRKDNWIDIHKLRAWRSGSRIYLDFHLILPRYLALEEAHHQVEELQQILKVNQKGLADVLIHAEPCIDSECPICNHDPCGLRRHTSLHQRPWKQDVLTSEVRQGMRSPSEDPRIGR